MKPLVDINVLMDVLARRAPFHAAAAGVWALAESGKVEALVPAASLPTVYYLGRRLFDRQRAREAVQRVVDVFTVVPVDARTIADALNSGLPDFEDAVQVFSGIHAGATHVISRDQRGFAGSPLIALTPEQFLVEFAKAP